ncbi:MAG TPA: HAD-IIA family hydrolase, partial [Solirubrobacteraceae bacterium]|nr:HAD-IIA family hydrolase [Solirubrobacteraceae bacterium]
MPLTPLASAYAVHLLDLDGCVWVGDDPTPGAVEAVDALRASGRSVGFLTNDGSHSPEEFVRKLWRLGFKASIEEVVTAGAALQHALNERHAGRSAFVIGSEAVHRHVADAGLRIVNRTTFASRADVVVVARHDRFDYEELRMAAQAVLRGAELVGASRDATFPMPDGPWPASGAVLAAVEAATGVEAWTVGKPEPQIFRTALDRFGDEERALVVGDRLDADVGGAAAAGLDAALVLTGATGEEEAREALAAAQAKWGASGAAPRPGGAEPP